MLLKSRISPSPREYVMPTHADASDYSTKKASKDQGDRADKKSANKDSAGQSSAKESRGKIAGAVTRGMRALSKDSVVGAVTRGMQKKESGGAIGRTKAALIKRLTTQIMSKKLHYPNQTKAVKVSKNGDSTSVSKILKHSMLMKIENPDQVAYILATAWLESKLGTWMTEGAYLKKKTAERQGETKYGSKGVRPARAKRHGHTKRGDGSKYMGRGFVQLTWKDNYKRMSKLLIKNKFSYSHKGVTYGDGTKNTKKIDLVANYSHASSNKDLAARILVLGMDGGHFVNNKKGLDHYLPDGKKAKRSNFESARRIVNGTNKKRLVAKNAQILTKILRKGGAWKKSFSGGK